ncbi:hypothetical protein Tco_0408400 [Tanacetum coccineum]
MDRFTMKALSIYWIKGDDEVELTDEESDDEDEIAKVFRIDTNIFDYETPLCSAFNEFNYLLKVDPDLLTKDIIGFKTYEDYKDDWIYEWNKDDYEWYEDMKDSELKDEALRNKAIMEGLINEDDDESCYEQKRQWNMYTNYIDAYEINHGNNEKEELCEVHELPACNIRRYMMIKYSFNNDEEYVAVKEDEYDDLTITRKEACQAYQEIFRIMDEGWMDLVKEISTKLVECIFSGILLFNWETAKYGKIWYDEDVYDLRSVETEFPAIVLNDILTSNETPSCEPMVSSLIDEIDFRISFDEFDDEDYMVVFDKNSFSYKILSTNDLKTDSKNDNEKVNRPLFLSPKPTVSCFDDLDFFKDFENEFPTIVYNDALTSKSDFLTEPTISPQHIDEFNLKDETSLSECDEEEQNVLYFNDLFSFNIIYPNDSKLDEDNDDDKMNIE